MSKMRNARRSLLARSRMAALRSGARPRLARAVTSLLKLTRAPLRSRSLALYPGVVEPSADTALEMDAWYTPVPQPASLDPAARASPGAWWQGRAR
jgi:hypothetical protein